MHRCIHAGLLKEKRLSLDELLEKLWSCAPDTGAVVIYIGRVKGPNRTLILQADDPKAAEEELHRIAEEAANKPSIHGAAVYTRLGRLKPGEPVAYIAVAAENRRAAIQTLLELVNAYKATKHIKHIDIHEDETYTR